MPALSTQAMTEALLADHFQRGTRDAPVITDPIADTPMVVTLDQLRPYDGNPRVTRNPMHDEIKSSIRARGLDVPPPITRRTGEEYFIIRNGGNTRLTILSELWAETKDERFFRLKCLFRPWCPRGEIVLLTGHLAENELRGELTFVEKALAVDKARQLYEQESGASLSQRDLSRRLTADGYPISQSHISRMQETVTYLLPAIPTILYAGLGRGLAERLTTLRRSSMRAWEKYAPRAKPTTDFASIFNDVLASFDQDAAFSVERVRDELLGQFAQMLATDYDTLALQIADAEMRQRVLTPESPTVADLPWPREEPVSRACSARPDDATPAVDEPSALLPQSKQVAIVTRSDESSSTSETIPMAPRMDARNSRIDRLESHIVSPAASTPRLEAIQRTIAQATGDDVESFGDRVVRAIPVQAGGLHPISDVWYIEAAIDSPERLRAHLLQLATEIAHEADLAHRIEAASDGIGYFCSAARLGAGDTQSSLSARALLSLLSALSAGSETRRPAVEGIRLADDLSPLLLGARSGQRVTQSAVRLSDTALVKLYRLIRLARRLVDLEQSDGHSTDL
jgi:ParB family protein of integrating conjugative element (PFGI_1 class)